ncbi:growth factor receptor-bound protein 10 isoform X2 [Ahaetulla prasina]|uniref:growth factor receptor-bound protein 10 isoform X2 n=1 Tax=Ahaetulla prasina TaxID=499056 RepID=UPI002649CCDD|nr:growth factor receptor-bound protein 10 isoform X2 [Ahaetulla prasina]
MQEDLLLACPGSFSSCTPFLVRPKLDPICTVRSVCGRRGGGGAQFARVLRRPGGKGGDRIKRGAIGGELETWQDSVDQTSAHTGRDLVEPGYQKQSSHISLNNQGDDDVDLEALVNNMNSSFESLCSSFCMHSESTPLLQNGSQLLASGTSSLHPVSPRQKIQRSQPVRIMAVRRLQEEEQQFRTSSLPAIPNPFPELCSPTNSPVLAPGSLPQSQPMNKQDIKVFSEDGTCKVVEILADTTARDLCQLLVYKSHCVDDNSWALVEHHPLIGLERCLEDHELLAQVESTMGNGSKFLFRKNYAKYEFFKNPVNFFPEQMIAWCEQSNGSIPQSQLLQEPRHLQLLADLEDSNIFSLIACKKMYSAPTDYGFCIKPNRVRNEAKELRLLCAEDEQSRTCWMTAFRLLKYGMLLYQNYRIPQQRNNLLPHFATPARSVSENSLVAMDFSGQIGRVIENPEEAQCAALEEGHAWRKRSTRILGNQSPLHPSLLSTIIHRTQHWFHGRISREESHRIIKQQGLVDGLFLLRDSQSNPKAFVLTLCHHQKIKHFQILPCEDDGQIFFSLDDGSTKFTDLIQLVEFYQLNKGVLPCKLKHHCIRVAL